MGINNFKMILKIGHLYKLMYAAYFYVADYNHFSDTDFSVVENTLNYQGQIFLYLGEQEHEWATDNKFYKFLFNNKIYYTETSPHFSATFEEVQI